MGKLLDDGMNGEINGSMGRCNDEMGGWMNGGRGGGGWMDGYMHGLSSEMGGLFDGRMNELE